MCSKTLRESLTYFPLGEIIRAQCFSNKKILAECTSVIVIACDAIWLTCMQHVYSCLPQVCHTWRKMWKLRHSNIKFSLWDFTLREFCLIFSLLVLGDLWVYDIHFGLPMVEFWHFLERRSGSCIPRGGGGGLARQVISNIIMLNTLWWIAFVIQ